MRLIVHGQQAFGQGVLKAILEKGQDEVVAVYCAPDKGPRMDPLKELALEKGLPLFQPTSYKSDKNPGIVDEFNSHNADLCVMAYVTLFVPDDVLNAPKHGSIQYHPSLLPDHKGPSSINWPIIMGKNATGLSIFWPDKGLDTGPILMQKHCQIGPDDTLGSIYFNHLFPLGVEAMLESIDLVRDGKAPKEVQDPQAGSYEGWCKKEDARIDWSKPAQEIYNLIRGTNPQPGAWTTFNGEEVKIFDSSVASESGEAGQVCALADDSFCIAAGNGSVRVERVRPAGAGKIKAAEFIQSSSIEVGSQFE